MESMTMTGTMGARERGTGMEGGGYKRVKVVGAKRRGKHARKEGERERGRERGYERQTG